MKEFIIGPEQPSDKQEIIQLLKSTGLNPESRDLVTKWRMQQEKIIDQNHNISLSIKQRIMLVVEFTDFYLASGDIDGAIENLNDAKYASFMSDDTELESQISTKIHKLQSGK